MKKTYIIPELELIAVSNLSLLTVSGVTGNGIGYGGVDDSGIIAPEAPPLELTPEKLLDIPF